MSRIHPIIRGANDIRSFSNLSKIKSDYVIYLRLAFIQMEKARRAKEKIRLAGLVTAADARCREIDVETKDLLAKTGEFVPRKESDLKHGRECAMREPTPAFRLRY